LFCYESQLTNPFLNGKNFKVNERYNIHQRNGERLCNSEKNEIQMNGFEIYYNIDYKTVEVFMDIAGRRYIKTRKILRLNRGHGSHEGVY